MSVMDEAPGRRHGAGLPLSRNGGTVWLPATIFVCRSLSFSSLDNPRHVVSLILIQHTTLLYLPNSTVISNSSKDAPTGPPCAAR